MQTLGDQLSQFPALNQVAIPDLWQQEAVSALRAGKDVVVHAPTGAGKTLIFELWSNQGKNRGQAIYTVPTRALANDKLAEWRARGWNVGIATGDLADNLSAPVLVATLETQKNRLIQGDGPTLLVVDEYQMLADADRGLNYELAIASNRAYGLQSIPGYLENGVPPRYGSGAETVVAGIHKNPVSKHMWINELTGPGDIDRVIIEWRSLLRQITHARDIDWPRWMELKALAKSILNETESPTMTQLPPLEFHQTKRVEHRLVLRRH